MNANAYEKLRQARLMKKMSLKDLAENCGLSYSYISQVERGEAKPSLASLGRLANALDLTVWELLKEENGPNTPVTNETNSLKMVNGPVNNHFNQNAQGVQGIRPSKLVRKNMRRSIILPQSKIHYEMVTPDLNCKIQVLLMDAEPGTNSGDDMFEHAGEECIYVLSGKLETQVGNEKFILEAGDSLYFSSEVPHNWVNNGTEKVSIMLIVTPPAY